MSYYTDYIIECDSLAFNRMLNEWREKRGDYETELPKPDYVWENIMADPLEKKNEMDDGRRYLLYSCINHGPCMSDVWDCLYVNLGLDERHFILKVKGECEKQWYGYGTMVDVGGYKELEYDENTYRVKEEHIPDGWLRNEYCEIVVDPNVWAPTDIDYTCESVKTKNVTEKTLEKIVEKLDDIVDLLTELCNHTADGK